MLSYSTRPRPRNPLQRRFKPIGEIIRTAKGKAIGRLLRHELTSQVEAFTRAGLGSLGRFGSDATAIAAIRKQYRARHR